MAKCNYSRKAIEDLTQIWSYSSLNWSSEQADKYYLQIIETCETISRNPELGEVLETIDLGLRKFPIQRHIIIYFIHSPNEILIVRILHSSMDRRKHL